MLLKSAQLTKFAFRYAAHVGNICDISEAESQYRHLVVIASDWNDLHASRRKDILRGLLRIIDYVIAAWNDRTVRHLHAVTLFVHPDKVSAFHWHDREWTVIDKMDAPFRGSGIFVFGKGVAEHYLECFQHLRLTVDVYRLAVDIVERADIIKSSSVVHVIVCQENGVDMTYILPEHLYAEIRPGVDEYRQAAVLHQGCGTQPLVVRVGGAAYGAVAADDRYALRCAGSEECQFSLSHGQMMMSVSRPTSEAS